MSTNLQGATAMRSVHASLLGRSGQFSFRLPFSLLPLLALLFVSGGVWGQADGDFRSRQSGDWNQGSTWDRYDGMNWLPQNAFPEIVATASSAKTLIAGTTHTISLPSGIESGDLLLIFWTDANTVNTVPTISADWVELYSSTAASRIRKAWYKVADGTETATIDVTAGAERSAHVAYRIASGTYQGTPAVATPSTGNTPTPDPPSLTPAFLNMNTLWIAAAHSAGDVSVITPPADYSDQVSGSSAGTGNPHALMNTASREFNGGTQDPVAFMGYSANRQWAANTVAIQGAAVTGAPSNADGVITVRNGHTIAVTAATTADQCIIDAGGQVVVNSGQTWTIADGLGMDLSVNGTVVNSGVITMTGTAEFNAAGTYEHAQNGGAVPIATWNSNSTCEVTGLIGTTVTGVSLNQSFGNFVWNCAGQTGNLNIATAAGTMSVGGNLEILNTGTGRVHLNQTQLDVTGNFIQSGGTFRLVNTANPRTLNVGGNFELSGAATLFIAKNAAGEATLNIDGNFIQTDGIFDQRAANTASNATVSVGGNFNLSGGTYDISGVNAVGRLNVAGDFSHTGGTLTETAGGIGNGVITFDGSTQQTYTGGGTLSNIINFVINNTGAGIQLLSSLTVNSNASLTFMDGIVDCNSNLVILSDGATTSGASAASFVDGPVQKLGDDAFIFPIGNGTTWAPLGISDPGTNVLDGFTAQYFATSSPDAALLNVGLERVSTIEHWDLDRINPMAMNINPVNITLFWTSTASAITDLMPMDGLTVAHFNQTTMLWEELMATVDMGSTASSGSITSAATNSFSPFSFGSTNPDPSLNPLPIELHSFTATPKSKTVQLDWRTASELNNAFFEIERSANGRDFENIGKVAGAGTSQTPLDYEFTDLLPLNGWNYYRLRQVDFDGEFSYSPIQAVLMGKAGEVRLQVFPNPANNELNLKTDRLLQVGDRIEIYDYTGRQVLHVPASDAVSAPITVSQLPAGTYIVRLRTAEQTVSVSFVKQQ